MEIRVYILRVNKGKVLNNNVINFGPISVVRNLVFLPSNMVAYLTLQHFVII